MKHNWNYIRAVGRDGNGQLKTVHVLRHRKHPSLSFEGDSLTIVHNKLIKFLKQDIEPTIKDWPL